MSGFVNNLHAPQAVPYTIAGDTDCVRRDRPYQTPTGFLDRPFIYAFDPSLQHITLTNGTDVYNVGLPLEAYSDFLVRRVAGLSTIAQKLQVRNKTQQQWFGYPMAFLNDMAVVPEYSYPPAAILNFDLLNIGQSANTNGEGGLNVPVSQLIFQGVRRFQSAGTDPWVERRSSYKFREKEYTYTMPVTVNWKYWVNPASATSSVHQPLRFSLEILDYDFDLRSINIYNPVANSWSNGYLKVLFYDGSERKLSNVPIIDYLYSSIGNGTSNQSIGNGVFPCPPVLYPIGSQIQFDVTSLLTDVVGPPPITFQFEFTGVRRLPI